MTDHEFNQAYEDQKDGASPPPTLRERIRVWWIFHMPTWCNANLWIERLRSWWHRNQGDPVCWVFVAGIAIAAAAVGMGFVVLRVGNFFGGR